MAFTEAQIAILKKQAEGWMKSSGYVQRSSGASNGQGGYTTTWSNVATGAATTVTTGANSATQVLGSTVGMIAGGVLHFATADVDRTIASVSFDGVTVVLTSAVSTTTSEAVSSTVRCRVVTHDRLAQEKYEGAKVESKSIFQIHLPVGTDCKVTDRIQLVTGTIYLLMGSNTDRTDMYEQIFDAVLIE